MMIEPATVRKCGASDVHFRLLATQPGYAAFRAASENRARMFALGHVAERVGITVIPVVVHIVYNQQSPEQNITNEQIQSQIDALNRDYRRQNADSQLTPPAFSSLIQDARIQFQWAESDVDRRATNVTSFATDDRVKARATGGLDAWPSDRYLNLWVCRLGGILGYAQFPGGPPATDGVVIDYAAFGTMGTARPPFNCGRTATHEIGHWLNLHHLWGDDEGAGCAGTDFVDDTPPQAGPNYGSPSFPHITCNNGPNGDMFMNYLDYTDDSVMVMFTNGQVTRMQACLDGDRTGLGTTPARWRPANVTADAGGPPVKGDPSCYVFAAEATQHVLHRCDNGHVQELWWASGSGWHSGDLTAATESPTAEGDPSGYTLESKGIQQVVYRSSDCHVRALAWRAGDARWHAADLTAEARAPLAVGDPMGYGFEAQGTQHVVFRSADGHVYELWWQAGNGWAVADLSGATGAPDAAGKPTGYVFDAQGTQHVVYRGADNHLHELWWQVERGWQHADLSAATAAPACAGDPMGYVFKAQGTQHVLYRGADNHLQELWWQVERGWQHADLSAATAAPACAGDPTGYVFDAQGTQHVVYRATDDHIHELWWQAERGWQHVSLTENVSAPVATGDPAGYVVDAQGSQHVVYRAVGDHVMELWWGTALL